MRPSHGPTDVRPAVDARGSGRGPGTFLQTAEELDVLGREIARLEQVTAAGAVAGKTLLERKYEQQKLQALLRCRQQRLLLHGLSAAQVDGILAKRTLLGEMTIFVPTARRRGRRQGRYTIASRGIEGRQGSACQGRRVALRAGRLFGVVPSRQSVRAGRARSQSLSLNRNWHITAVIPSKGAHSGRPWPT